ncbi:hypothetical protein CAS74_004231 [Pichia kudriavzevii]|uniref:Protein RER1 n=1 Tax=Pichia kudriavzevii TaxID=4909 RepID=A0A099NVY5_PICKU|nr:uncharacterized protein C5L36_0A08560 [Pichia kudriavzevii]AWU74258.1 hypothetical protein C5L36_0A08560 [Pichia kudriavzevii]KGK36938.1 hypothetical protein JL09_g3916 [Pichia kudriavzevii]ONH73174.1 Protein RER1 [Pichia kudriavzevii]OUT20570.1 hypothetical protein CAS74_004231 [Pichia kudriavzevii]
MEFDDEVETSQFDVYRHKFDVMSRQFLDYITPHIILRWIAAYILVMIFMSRIVWVEGWYIVCYTWAIFLLNMFLKFLTPKFDPSIEQDIQNESVEEGTSKMDENDEEFRPFIRRLPEFRFWLKTTVSTLIAIFCSFFSIFDIPVFWPILVVYFIILFLLTMKRQIQHMIKYRYLPFDLNKAKYASKK